MAKLYGEIASKALLTLDKSFARANGQPLDASEVYYSLAAAQEYAAGAQAYIGQKIVVIENGVVTHYSVNDEAGTLKELGSKPVADGTTVSIGADGKITLANIAEKAEGTYNAVLVNGVLTWVKPSETTVEGLSDLIQSLTGRVDAHDTAIEANADAIKAIADDYLKAADKTELADAIADEQERAEEAEKANADAIKAIKDDYLKAADKTELANAIAAEKDRAEEVEANLQTQINTIMSNPDAEGAINSINEFAQYVKDHGDIAEGFRTDINKNKEDISAIDDRVKAVEEFDHSVYATVEAVNGIKGDLEDAIAAEADRAKETEEANAAAIEELKDADLAIVGRIEGLEAHDHDSYASKSALEEVKTTAENANTAVGNLETRFDEIVAVGGEPNAINTIKVNGAVQAIENKVVDIAVPTKFSDITDDSGFNDRINAAQAKGEQGVSLANAAQSTANQAQNEVDALELVVGGIQTTVSGHTTALAGHEGRIAELEAADIAHKTEYETLSGLVGDHTAAIAKKADITTVDGVIAKANANEAAIETLNNTTVPAINAEIAKKADASALANYHTKSEIEAITGAVAEGKTLVQMIADAKDAATYDDTEVRDLIADEVDRAKAAEEANAKEIARVNGVLVAALENDAEGLDSIKELATWIEDHGEDAAQMVTNINDNAAAIAAINHETTGVLAQAKLYTDAQINGLPAATAEKLGLVKVDDVTIKADNGVISVKAISTDLLVQGNNQLILRGGSASD